MAKRLTAAPPASARPATDGALERGLAAAANRVKWQDGLTGLAAVAVLVLGYAVAAVLLDRWLALPAGARQLAFAGLLAAVASVGYRFIVRPMQKAVNPRYVARRVEGTLDGTKNEIINWVDMRERDISGSIRASVDAKAAAGLADADVPAAFRSRGLAWLGGAAMVLVGVLAVLFLVFKAGQFTSLLGRAFNPFGSGVIASRTTIELLEPDPADATLTDGEQLRLVVRVTGRKPSADGPDRVRLLTKQTADATQWDETTFTLSTNPREYDLTVGRGLIQNGFWYKVAAGDGETAEHRIDVRTRPLVTGFEARYEYPAYTRMAPDVGREPRIEAHRGTVVTLTVKTNRAVKAGWITFDGKPVPQAGSVPAEARDSVRFTFKLDERTNYRVQFTGTDGDASGPSPAYPVEVIADRAPAVAIDAPEPEEAAIPLGGLLAVDGTIGDDFGIDTATLVVKVQNPNGTAFEVRKPYLAGKSLKREKDGTFPTALKYQDSLKLENLKAGNVSVPLAADMVAEYWLEATDNCTEPKANVGRSAVKRVKLLPPPPPEKKPEQEKAAAKRQADEKNQQTGEQGRRDAEKRTPPQQRPDRQPEKKPNPDDKQEGDDGNDPNQSGKAENNPNAKPPEGERPDQQHGGKEGNPKNDPNNPGNDEKGPKPENPEDVKRKAEEIQRRIDEANREASKGKGDPNAGDPNPQGETKPAEAKPNDGNPNADPKGGTSKPAESKPGEGAADTKEPGQPKPPETATDKPAPTQEPNGGSKPENQPSGEPKPEPKGGQTGGEEKPNKPEPGSTGEPKGNDAGEAKPAAPKQDGQPPEKNPAKDAAKSKPNGASKPGEEKPSPNEDEGDPQPNGGGGQAKNEKPTDPGAKKGPPKQPQSGDKPGAEKGSPEGNPDQANPGADKPSGDEKGAPTGSEPKQGEKQPENSPPKAGKNGQKPDAKGIENAVNDLDSPDKDKQQAARDTLDKAVGQEGREKAEQLKKDLQSGDKARQDAAKKELDELKKRAGQGGGGEKKEPTKEELEQFQKDAQDLNSKDDDKRKAAENKLDKQMGKANREKAQQLQKDAQSGDPDKKAAAEKELAEMAKQAGQQPQDGGPDDPKAERKPTQEEIDEIKKNAKDLNSPDDAKRKAAEQKLDEQIGKGNREKLQEKARQLENDAKSGDQQKRDATDRELQDLIRENAEQAKNNPNRREQREGDAEQLRRDAQDLASDNPQKKKDAEDRLDKKLGEQARKDLQKDAQDAQGPDQAKADAAKDSLDKKVKEQAQKLNPGGNGGKGQEGEPLAEDRANRRKTAERQLENFKKYKGNKDFLKQNNMTEADYERFLKGYEDMLAREKAAEEQAQLNPPSSRPAGPATLGQNDGSGGRVEAKPAAGTVEGPGGSGVAPPGFDDAGRGFVVPRRPKK